MRDDKIEVNPQVMMGKPVIRGTRITIEAILRKLSKGSTEQDLLDAYPGLTPEDIRAAVGYAADLLGNGEEKVRFSEPSSELRNELDRIKAARFPTEGQQERIAAALRALDEFRWKPRISAEDLRWIAQDVDVEDL
jgi:uncharacterized protein (DUF433 family)